MLKTVSSITNAIGALNYKGTWNASTNTPTITSSVGEKGDYYVVSVGGTTNINGISNWGVGDWITFNGSVWQRVEGGADLNGVNLSVSGTTTLSGLTASTALALNASKEAVSVTNTGTGNNVLADGPTLTTPALGAATATSINKIALTAPATGSTLTIADGKTLTANHSLTLAGTDATTMTFPSTSASIARTDAAQTFTGAQTFNDTVTATKLIPTGNVTGGNGMYLPAANIVAVSTNGAEVFRMDSSQRTNFGGTSFTPNYKFAITFSGGSNNGFLVENTASSGGPAILTLADSGQTVNNTQDAASYTDTTAQRWTLRKNGGLANYQANNANLSDRREKTNFNPAKNYLDVICAIPVQTFNYIDQAEDDPGLTLGVIAQDVQAVAPELVMESDWSKEGDGSKMRLSIYQTDLQYALMKCIQEQQQIIENLEARINVLESSA